MTAAPQLRSHPVPTLTLCVICARPVPIASGRDLCLGCLGGEARPEPERPRVAGSDVAVSRRLKRRDLSAGAWEILDALAAGCVTPAAIGGRLGVPAGEVARRVASITRAPRQRLVDATPEGYALTAEGSAAVAARVAPPLVVLARRRLESGRERQARYRARVRAGRGGGA